MVVLGRLFTFWLISRGNELEYCHFSKENLGLLFMILRIFIYLNAVGAFVFINFRLMYDVSHIVKVT